MKRTNKVMYFELNQSKLKVKRYRRGAEVCKSNNMSNYHTPRVLKIIVYRNMNEWTIITAMFDVGEMTKQYIVTVNLSTIAL